MAKILSPRGQEKEIVACCGRGDGIVRNSPFVSHADIGRQAGDYPLAFPPIVRFAYRSVDIEGDPRANRAEPLERIVEVLHTCDAPDEHQTQYALIGPECSRRYI